MDLETFEDPSELYLALRDEVNSDRPLFTGDVFADVPALGFGEPAGVVIVAHPCTFRQGASLRDSVLVCPVERPGQSIGRRMWQRGHFDWTPLPNVEGDGLLSVGNLEQMTRSQVPDLMNSRRLACMSEFGINLLQQRLTFHLTRTVIPTTKFDEAFSQYFEEVDSLEEWIGTLREVGVGARDATQRFEEFVRAGPQARMRDRQFRALVRIECRQEAARQAEAIRNANAPTRADDAPTAADGSNLGDGD